MNKGLKELRALIVDDSRLMCDLLRGVLTAVGVGEIRAAREGYEAIELLRASPSDVMFVDWEMKPMNGLDFVKYVRRSPIDPDPTSSGMDPSVPIIMVTSHAAL